VSFAWVIGRGGLLGSALERALARSGTTLFVPRSPFTWRDGDVVTAEMRNEAVSFAQAVGCDESWEIYWAAGVGTMGSKDAALFTETRALGALLDAVEHSTLSADRGRLALASSAGAIYAGSTDPVISENTIEQPTTPYAHAKLAEEHRARDYAQRTGVRLLIGRISTLYGVGQASEKEQGLLTHISRCMIRNQPVKIFVPLDTIRDYIGADDAAAMLVDSLRFLDSQRTVMKIIASERPVTISEVLSIFKRLARRPPRIVTSGTSTSSIYARRIQFSSVVAPMRVRQPLSLLIGISQILAAERLRYVVAGVSERA